MSPNGFQNYQRQALPVEPEAVGREMAGPSALPMMGAAGPDEHSPESTDAAMRHAVGMALARKANIPGKGNLRQLRQMGIPESELFIDRQSGLVEGDDE